MATITSEGSVLGPTTRIVGRVTGKGSVRVEGTAAGGIEVTGPAEIAPGATVEGNVRAETLDLGGTLQGDVDAAGPVLIRAEATARGQLRGSQVSIEPGSRVSVLLDTAFEVEPLERPRTR
jgi:cytoskeletal protein CcmA (bactofilin family)